MSALSEPNCTSWTILGESIFIEQKPSKYKTKFQLVTYLKFTKNTVFMNSKLYNS